MKERIDKVKEKLTAWLTRHAQSRYALWLLGILSVLDAIAPPAPPDVLLIPMILANKKRWFFLATFSLACSLVGGIAAYLIGAGLFNVVGHTLIEWTGGGEKFAQLGVIYQSHAFIAIFGAAFTPVPDTVFTIGAGVFKISMPWFLLAYFCGRALRLYPEAFIVYLYGPAVARVIYKYFNIISLVLITAIIAVLILVY